jgi:hypothetical protein
MLGEAESLLDGYSRRFSRAPLHMWISDPHQALPQEVELTWDQPQTIQQVTLVFDNLVRHRHDQPWENGTRVAPFLIKEYEVLCREQDTWRVITRETCNYHRFRQHQFAPFTATALKLRVLATHGGSSSARVYQVRVR